MSRILVRTLLVVVASTVLGGQTVHAQLTKQLPESAKKVTTPPAKPVGDTKLAPRLPSPFQASDPKPLPPWVSPQTSKLLSGGLYEPDLSRLSLAGKHAWSLPTPTKPILNLTKFPEERLIVAKLDGYPNLGSDFEVLAPTNGACCEAEVACPRDKAVQLHRLVARDHGLLGVAGRDGARVRCPVRQA